MIEVYGLNETFIRKSIQFFCKFLDIDIPKITIFIDETIKANGECYKNDDEYMILLKETDDATQLMKTLAHELVHVKQYAKDDLENRFDLSIPYMNRWWEQEAYMLQTQMITDLVIEMEETHNAYNLPQ